MTGAPSLIVRAAVPVDAPAMAALHVRAWRATYAGLMPGRVPRGLNVEEREARWRHSLTAPEVAPGRARDPGGRGARRCGGLRGRRSRARRRRVRAGRAVRDQRRSARVGPWRGARAAGGRDRLARRAVRGVDPVGGRRQPARPRALRAGGLVSRRRDEDRRVYDGTRRRTTAATAAPPSARASSHAGVRHARQRSAREVVRHHQGPDRLRHRP